MNVYTNEFKEQNIATEGIKNEKSAESQDVSTKQMNKICSNICLS